METVEQAKALFVRLSRLDLDGWDAARLCAVAAALGWEPDDAMKPTLLATGLGTGPALVVPAPGDIARAGRADGTADHGSREGTDGGGGRYAALRVPVGPASTFAEAVEAASGVMGFPPPMIGGPGPWVRWRRAPSRPGAAGTSVGLLRADDTVWVELVATRTWETMANRWLEGGEGIDDLPYRWLAFRRHPSLKGLTTGGRVVDDWERVERGLALTLDDLLDAAEVLARPGAAPPPAGSLRLTRRDRSITAFFDVDLGPGRALALRKTSTSDLSRQGWHRLDKRTWRCEWPSAGPAECDEAARIAVRTLREDLHCWLPADAAEPMEGHRPAYARTKLAGRSNLDLPGLGIARSRDDG